MTLTGFILWSAAILAVGFVGSAVIAGIISASKKDK